MQRHIVIVTDETAEGFARQVAAGELDPDPAVLSEGSAEAGVMELLERVDLEWLNTLKLTLLGQIQHRRRKVERAELYKAG